MVVPKYETKASYCIHTEMYKQRLQDKLPDIMYRIHFNPDKKSADTHVLHEYVKNADDTYSVGQEVAKGNYESFSRSFLTCPSVNEATVQTYEIYQLKSGDELCDIRFEPYESLEKRGSKPEYANYEKVYEDNAAGLSGDLGEKLESHYNKFNLDRSEDFKGHLLSVSDVVVLWDKDILC